MTKFDEVLTALRAEHQRLAAQLTEAHQAMEKLREEIRRVERAMSALSPNDTIPVADFHRPRRTRKPTLDGNQVMAMVTRVLGESGSLTKDDLRARVAELAEAAGKSRAGLPLILGRVLKRGHFRQVGAKWEILGAGRS